MGEVQRRNGLVENGLSQGVSRGHSRLEPKGRTNYSIFFSYKNRMKYQKGRGSGKKERIPETRSQDWTGAYRPV